MKTLIISALFPPDVAAPAQYAKELASRLDTGEISLLVYGKRPETVPNVTIDTVSKRSSVFIRLPLFFFKLLKHLKRVDRVILTNGPSVELPLLIARLFFPKPFLFVISDDAACERSKNHTVLAHGHSTLRSLSSAYIDTIPPQKPEILPFEAYPETAIAAYSDAWDAHLEVLRQKLL